MRKKRSLAHHESIEDVSINLTPLLDVIFVVLIMFILIAPLLELDRIQLAQASAKESKQMAVVEEASPVAIYVFADNRIRFNSKFVTREHLLPLLKEAKKKYPNRTPQLFPDKKAEFGTYQAIKNAIEQAGFEQLDIILQPD